jgi:hypothetical protein
MNITLRICLALLISISSILLVVGYLGGFSTPDLIPRTLPAQMHDLPVACIIYDLIVACYLAWAVSRGRIVALGRR